MNGEGRDASMWKCPPRPARDDAAADMVMV